MLLRHAALVGVVALVTLPAGARQTIEAARLSQLTQATPAAQATQATQSALIRGTVTAAGTGAPIRGAEVRVRPAGVAAPSTDWRWAVTDEFGQYEIAGVPPGRYDVSAAKTGYVTLAYGQRRPAESGRPVDVTRGASLGRIDFTLPRGGILVARVTDRFGDPVRGLTVRPYQIGFPGGQRRLEAVAASPRNVTDDRGEVRLFGLPPGDYYLAAAPAMASAILASGEGVTYYPGTLIAAEAQPIRLGLGEEIAVTFPIVRARPSHISGTILGSTGAPLADASAALAFQQPDGGGMRSLRVGADGSFSEMDLPPGDYTLLVRSPEYARHDVRLTGEDVAGLVIATKKRASFRGRFLFAEGAPPAGLTPDRLTLRPSGSFTVSDLFGASGSVELETGDDWRFTGHASGAGALTLRAPEGWYLKTVVVQGRDVTDVELDLASALDGRDVEVVVTRRHSEVTGTVADDRAQLIADCAVVIFPADESQWTAWSRFIARGRPDQYGRFALNGLPPGDYFIAAVDYLAPGGERNRDMLAQLRPRASLVTLKEAESRAMNLRLQP